MGLTELVLDALKDEAQWSPKLKIKTWWHEDAQHMAFRFGVTFEGAGVKTGVARMISFEDFRARDARYYIEEKISDLAREGLLSWAIEAELEKF